jgi:hypothetical protein
VLKGMSEALVFPCYIGSLLFSKSALDRGGLNVAATGFQHSRAPTGTERGCVSETSRSNTNGFERGKPPEALLRKFYSAIPLRIRVKNGDRVETFPTHNPEAFAVFAASREKIHLPNSTANSSTTQFSRFALRRSAAVPCSQTA